MSHTREDAHRALTEYEKIDAIARYEAELHASAQHAADLRRGKEVPANHLQQLHEKYFTDVRQEWETKLHGRNAVFAKVELERRYRHAMERLGRWKTRIREQQALTEQILKDMSS